MGSFFVNPVVSLEHADTIESVACKHEQGDLMPRFPAAHGRCKLAAAWLIERAGFARGYVGGRVGLSSRHALAIINRAGPVLMM
ncbi:MAG: hypothetical protein R3C68_02455 [Myxococcota bacterium]